MNRKDFFKNAIGVTVATVVGNKLDFIPEPSGLPPGVGMILPRSMHIHEKVIAEYKHRPHMVINMPKGQFQVNDVIMTGSGQKFFVHSRNDEGLIAKRMVKDPDDDDAIWILFIHEYNPATTKVLQARHYKSTVKLFSMIPEKYTYKESIYEQKKVL